MGKVLAIVNQKGGVAKTTSTVNIAFALAQHGAKVLCIDADPQGDLTDYFGFDQDELEEKQATLYYALLKNKLLAELVIGSNPFIIPSSISLANAEPELMSDAFSAASLTLRRILRDIRKDYDFILIDCMPSLSIVTANALAAADLVLVPIKTDRLSYRGFQRLLESIHKAQTRLNPDLGIYGVVPTLHNPSYSHDRETLERIQTDLGKLGIRCFPPVNRATNFDKGLDHKKPTLAFAPETPGAQVYSQIAAELLATNATQG
jgi:chromosome partitioning protein